MGEIPYNAPDMDCIKCGKHDFLDVYYRESGEAVPDECKCASCGKTMAIEDAERTHQGLTWDEWSKR